MHISTGFYSADLFYGWDSSDIELYDEAESADLYAALCKAAIKEDYPKARVEVLYQSGATGSLPYNLQTQIDNISVTGADSDQIIAIAAVDDIVGKVYADYNWCVKKAEASGLH